VPPLQGVRLLRQGVPPPPPPPPGCREGRKPPPAPLPEEASGRQVERLGRDTGAGRKAPLGQFFLLKGQCDGIDIF
jgi:hypothetical protein